ncbi:MAG: UDP-N-acetylmuramate--L-alanine ligase [Pirellulales bacterium]|nr:UDP-N-acetylmuramate--L-alanine ligase [Pirellulales bacterium]
MDFPSHVHLIGVAGSGMRALAEVLHGWGTGVSGSDLTPEEVEPFATRGMTLFTGHDAGHLPSEADLVVHSDAVPLENPERQRAVERGLRVRSYFEMLGELTAGRHLIAVAGSHGKSTTAALLGQILSDAGMDPTVFCGAASLGRVSGGRPGNRRLFVAEACEYRRNFLSLRPQQAAILGVEADHFDCYPAAEDLEAAFTEFVRLIPPSGYLLARHDCPATQRAVRAARCRVESFGLLPKADWSAEIPISGSFTVLYRGRPQFTARLSLPGRHQVLNALAATVLSLKNSVVPERIRSSLARFAGLKRRFELAGRRNGIVWIDDYAHHPTEVEIALQTARQVFQDCRIYCVFQPHQVLRTARLLDEFAGSLHNADIVLIAEIYRAREGPPQNGEITAADLAERLRQSAPRASPLVPEIHDFPGMKNYLQSQLQAGDVLLTLGAGDIRKVFDGIFAGI